MTGLLTLVFTHPQSAALSYPIFISFVIRPAVFVLLTTGEIGWHCVAKFMKLQDFLPKIKWFLRKLQSTFIGVGLSVYSCSFLCNFLHSFNVVILGFVSIVLGVFPFSSDGKPQNDKYEKSCCFEFAKLNQHLKSCHSKFLLTSRKKLKVHLIHFPGQQIVNILVIAS